MINNDDRFTFIMFVIWCKIHREDHTDTELNQKEILMSLGDEDYEKLHSLASFAVLVSVKCPICWEPWDIKIRLDCSHCGVTAVIDEKKKTASIEDVV